MTRYFWFTAFIVAPLLPGTASAEDSKPAPSEQDVYESLLKHRHLSTADNHVRLWVKDVSKKDLTSPLVMWTGEDGKTTRVVWARGAKFGFDSKTGEVILVLTDVNDASLDGTVRAWSEDAILKLKLVPHKP